MTWCKRLGLCLSAALLLLATVPMTAWAKTSEGYGYSLMDDGTIQIESYEGQESELVIPSEIDGYPVSTIHTGAFMYNAALTSVTLPDTITSIGDSVFFGCTSLETLSVPNTITSIGRDILVNTAYSNEDANWEDGALYVGPYLIDGRATQGDYVVKGYTRTIAAWAFGDDGGMTTVTIPASVEFIGEAAFGAHFTLQAIEVDDDNPYYSDIDGVLYNKEQTKLLAVPQNGCDTGSFTVPQGVTTIGAYAFWDIVSLDELILPSTLTTTEESAFGYLRLESIDLPEGMTTIGPRTFRGCQNLVNVTLPSSVTSIGQGAFSSCVALKTVTIPAGVTEMGWFVFSDNLTDVYYGGSEEEWNALIAPVMMTGLPDTATVHFGVGDDTVLGDMDGNGILNMMDALQVYAAASGAIALSESDMALADITGDGAVNMMDALMLYGIASGN